MGADKDYIIRIRRELHQIPEIGYDLPKTLALVRRELDALDIPYTEEYGKSSIIATLNEGAGNKTIALRADMDALPIQEETGYDFASIHPGQMHACGHDCHTAMLLGTAKALKEMEKDINCCVKLVFQPAEEGKGGAKLICDDGFMDDVDMIIGAHVYPDKPTGTLSLNKVCQYASNHSFKIWLNGKSAHVSQPHNGIDAIAMAVRVFNDIQFMRARELDPSEPVVIGIGEIHGGTTNNIICSQAMLHGTIRTINDRTDAYIYRRIEEIAASVAGDMGGTARVETTELYPVLHNDQNLAAELVRSAEKIIGADKILEQPIAMVGEDFAFYAMEKPGVLFNFGVMPEDGNFAPLHNSKMTVNEAILDIAPNIFIQFILDQMNK